MAQAVFLFFLFFIFFFYKNIFSFSKFTEIYPGRPTAERPGSGRPAAGRHELFCKIFRGEFALKPLEDRSPDSGAAGPPGCPRCRRPSFASPKIQKKIHRSGTFFVSPYAATRRISRILFLSTTTTSNTGYVQLFVRNYIHLFNIALKKNCDP